MSAPVIFTYPSKNGYQFVPAHVEGRAAVLETLNSIDDAWVNGISISPFVHASWIRHGLSMSKAIFVVGVTSRGIVNSAHRGSYSTWTAGKIVSTRKSFSTVETMDILHSVFEEFTIAIKDAERCQSFFEAFSEYVVLPAGVDRVQTTVDDLSLRVGDDTISKNVSMSPLLWNIRRLAFGQNRSRR